VAQKRLSVRKIREVLRLKIAGVSDRKIGTEVGWSSSTLKLCLKWAGAVGNGWLLPEELDDVALEALLYPKASSRHSRPAPDLPC
jgi:hypothetical protein